MFRRCECFPACSVVSKLSRRQSGEFRHLVRSRFWLKVGSGMVSPPCGLEAESFASRLDLELSLLASVSQPFTRRCRFSPVRQLAFLFNFCASGVAFLRGV